VSCWLITGCSSGIGRAIATAALDAGHSVVVTARRPETVADLVAGPSPNVPSPPRST
jgi:NAD(P)-dependent dehydrogenase (short-subunit alcohol dehydrogenase family)